MLCVCVQIISFFVFNYLLIVIFGEQNNEQLLNKMWSIKLFSIHQCTKYDIVGSIINENFKVNYSLYFISFHSLESMTWAHAVQIFWGFALKNALMFAISVGGGWGRRGEPCRFTLSQLDLFSRNQFRTNNEWCLYINEQLTSFTSHSITDLKVCHKLGHLFYNFSYLQGKFICWSQT